MSRMKEIAQQFQIEGRFIEARPFGDGHVNDTYVLEYENGEKKERYLMQRISSQIFPDISLIMDNIEKVLLYMQEQCPGFRLIKTKENKNYYRTEEGLCYRVYTFIEHAVSYDKAQSSEHVKECGKMVGLFEQSMEKFTFDPAYYEMTKDFHNSVVRYERFLSAVDKDVCNRVKEVTEEIAFYKERKEEIGILIKLWNEKSLPLRATHNDLRLSNIMIDRETDKGAAMVDLDTVTPGLAAYDYGDAIRSAAKHVCWSEGKVVSAHFDLELAKDFTVGYLSVAKKFLTKQEIDSLADGILVMSLECGMRYLTDYLEGDLYFYKNKNGENRQNARREMFFVKEVEKQIDSIRAFILKQYNDK